MDIFEYGDPYIEWNEEIAAQESNETEGSEMSSVPEMHVETLESLKAAVVKLLMSDYEFLVDEAEELVENSVDNNPDVWNENAEPADLAKYLASEDEED